MRTARRRRKSPLGDAPGGVEQQRAAHHDEDRHAPQAGRIQQVGGPPPGAGCQPVPEALVAELTAWMTTTARMAPMRSMSIHSSPLRRPCGGGDAASWLEPRRGEECARRPGRVRVSEDITD